MIKILKYSDITKDEIFARQADSDNVEGIVSDIIENVKKNGDSALFEYAKRFDGAELDSLMVTSEEMLEAVESVDKSFIEILRRAADNIRAFHKKQVRSGYMISEKNGVVMGQKVMPIEKVGLYVPGGTAAYPSTVLMDSIPAKIAGCSELVMVSPPNGEGKINPVILAAAHVAGVDKIFKVGGAQAVAALSYGTETVPRVDKIVGPGNKFVAEAKKQVFGQVSIDMIAGPSEILIIADGATNPKYAAADLLSQAEHDKMASAVMVTDCESFAEETQKEIEKQIATLERCDIARASIDNNGKIIVVDTIDEAIDISNEIAPEHLELCVDTPFDYINRIKHAGSIFMGRHCPEALGDYMAGPNHTLPTGGTARFSSPLSVDDFVKTSQYTYFTKEALAELAYDVESFAKKEGLTAHAKSAVVRLEE